MRGGAVAAMDGDGIKNRIKRRVSRAVLMQLPQSCIDPIPSKLGEAAGNAKPPRCGG